MGLCAQNGTAASNSSRVSNIGLLSPLVAHMWAVGSIGSTAYSSQWNLGWMGHVYIQTVIASSEARCFTRYGTGLTDFNSAYAE